MKKINILKSGSCKRMPVQAAILIFVLIGAVQTFAQQKIDENSVAMGEGTENQVSQNVSDKVEIIESGILNDQAVYLSQPVYPSKAKAAKVKGEVKVEVVINAKGIVIAAKAVSGNALLRNSAEWAARRTKFRSAKKHEEVVHIKGIIVFTFQ